MRIAYAVFSCDAAGLAICGRVTPLVVASSSCFAAWSRPSDLGVRGATRCRNMPADRLIRAMSIVAHHAGLGARRGALAGASIVGLFGMAPAY
jgi:hypothetical protein